MKDNKYKYQIVVVLSHKSENKDKVLENISSKIVAMSGEVISKNNLGIKDLVYEIKDQNKGDFWDFEVESAKPLQVNEFNLFLNRDSNILRYLILKI